MSEVTETEYSAIVRAIASLQAAATVAVGRNAALEHEVNLIRKQVTILDRRVSELTTRPRVNFRASQMPIPGELR